ncbi:MAG: dephospho-CoA kinase [Cyclobacteriaceae bacterium]
MTLKVGITGGIGAGKSTAAKFFHILQVPIYFADDRAKWLMNHDEAVKNKIISLFGHQAYTNNNLNRRLIAEKVFDNQSLLDHLNVIVHPAVGNDFSQWVSDQKSPYVLKEAALLFESGSYKALDKIIHVSASEELRIRRIKKRDPQRSEEEIKSIIAKQWAEDMKKNAADYVIMNEDQLLIPQILEIDEKLRLGL